jgi:hypothetical protein
LATYIHGVTEEIATSEIGAEGVPILLELLRDPSFPRRDNVVAFLSFLGGERETDGLVRLLREPPAPASLPEEDRALLLVPQALGHIASRGERNALEALLAMTENESGGDPGGLRGDLLEMALRGLALSGTEEAKERLRAVAEGEIVPDSGGPSLRSNALAALDLLERQERRQPRQLRSSGTTLDDQQETLTGTTADYGFMDHESRVHESGLSYANHVEVSDPMIDSRLDEVLRLASLRAGRGDFSSDVACCATLSRSGTAGQFGTTGDGLDIIDDDGELQDVLNHPSGRFKVVRAINHCGGPGVNIIGCAWMPGNGAAVVRMSSEIHEAILWIHEYGHNTGLSHNTISSRYLMYGTNNGSNDGLTQEECDSYHYPNVWSDMTTEDIGACTDNDDDVVQDLADNCPDVSNHDQADADGDGVGDACTGGDPVCGDDARDVGEECDGQDLGGQTCQSFGYRAGSLTCNSNCTLDQSACSCMDGDDDGRGDPGFPLGTCDADCNDSDPGAWSVPGEARDLRYEGDKATFSWMAPIDPGAVSLWYDVLRSENAQDFLSAICLEEDDSDTIATDYDIPPVQGAFFYLARAENACPSGRGSLGFDSEESERSGTACP